MSRKSHRRWIAPALIATSTLIATTAAAQVTATGDYTSEIPIDVPAFRGMAPSVRVRYAAGGGGLAGVGWSLDAASTILRTGPRGGVPLDPPGVADRFVLDGEPLVPCAPGSASPSCTTALHTRGTAAGFFSTRRESFERIEHQGGTAPFTVWLTDGRTAHYETFDAGRSWLLTRSQDRHGNGIDYAWGCAPGFECELASITWGDHAGTRGAEVHFYYEPRPDLRSRGTGAAFVLSARRLRSITVEVGGALARGYAFSYTTSAAAGRSLLAAVQQYPRDAVLDKTADPGRLTAGPTPLIPPTTYLTPSATPGTGWQFAALPVATGAFSLADLPTGPAPRHYQAAALEKLAGIYYNPDLDDDASLPYQPLVGDFDGDGRADVAVVYVRKKCQTVGVNGVLTRKGGYATLAGKDVAKFNSPGTQDCTPHAWVADVDGDHRDDVVFKFRDTLYSAGLATQTTFGAFAAAPAWTTSPDHCAIADVDGDARDDLVCLTDQSGQVRLVTARSQGDGAWTTNLAAPGVGLTDPMTTGDLNGDGFADVAFALPVGGTRGLVVLRSRGDGTYATETQLTTWPVAAGDDLATTDIDGDGLADLVLTRHAAGAYGVALSAAGVGPRFDVRTANVGWGDALLADVDGDGRGDLVSRTNLTAMVGDGAGGFAPAVTAYASTTCAQPFTADTDGDGRTDLLCIDDQQGPGMPLTIDDYPSVRPARDPHRWLSGDLDGDGQGDYVYVYARNPGLGVISVLAAGGVRRVWSAWPTPAFPGLDDSSATHWLVADVGGPGGRADGKDDLVMVDTDGSTLRVYALLSKGDGTYTPVTDQPWRDPAGNLLSYAAPDLGNFFPIDVDGDGDADLVHPRAATSGIQLDLLVAKGNGTWTRSTTTYFAGATPAFAAASDFRPMEVNGDGLVDLVNVQSGVGMTGTVVRSLLSRGDGTFRTASDTQSAAYLDIARWQPVDLNGDGLTDLLHVQSGTNGAASWLYLDHLVSRGDGTFIPSLYATATLATYDPELTRALEATTSLYPADLDGDGVTDLLHVSTYRDAAGNRGTVLVRLHNPNVVNGLPVWTVPTPSKVAGTVVPPVAPWNWRGYRAAARPNAAGVMLITATGATTATFDIPSDRLSRIDNGNGGRTEIEYGALVGQRDYLPAGALPIVTTAVTRTDLAYGPRLVERTTYAYSGATWSDAQARLLGFSYLGVRDPRLTAVTHYATDEACAGVVLDVTTSDAATGEVLGYSTTTPVGPGATAPFTCLVQDQTRYSCQGGTCQLDEQLVMTHDTYGNVVATSQRVTGAPTRDTYTPVSANEADYVVSLPMYRAVYENATKLLAQDLFEYDTNTTYNARPGGPAEVRTIRRWDDSNGGRYVASTLEYDAHGLLRRAIDPEGGFVETVYDATYQAFPQAICDAVGCTSVEVDPVDGHVIESKDLNGSVTRFHYDGYGRLAEVTRPDGSFTRTRFLDLGTFAGPIASRQRTRTEVSDGSPHDGVVWTEQALDGWGRTYRVESEGGTAQTTDYVDLTARPWRKSEVFAASGAPTRFTEYGYDALGRPTAQQSPDGSLVKWQYDLGTVTVFDELARSRTLAYDGLGEVIRVTERLGGVDRDTTYGYDGARRLIGVVDPVGNWTEYQYDTMGRLVAERDPDRGLRQYTYRTDGKLETSLDAKGQRVRYGYDVAGRTVRRADFDVNGDATRKVQWIYDELPGLGPQGASRGHVVQVVDDQAAAQTHLETRMAYDSLGRVSEQTDCIDGACYALRSTYDLAGRLDTLTYPDATGGFGPNAEVVTHHYDEAGRLIEVGPYVLDIQYELDGRPRQYTYGNKVVTEYAYDPDRRWTDSVTISSHGALVYQAGYAHDLLGRITDLAETAPTNIDTMHFDYDELGRLTGVRASDPALDRDYVVDAIGRITYSSQLGDYHYTDPDHAHAMTHADHGADRAYDANGNVVYLDDPSGRTLKITWTVDDRPATLDGTAGTFAMAYDVAGRRVKKDGPGDSARYYGDHIAVENGAMIKYYYAGARLVARDDGAQVAYYHEDHTHAVRVETDAAGAVANSYQYDATGNPVRENERFDDNIGFGGVHGDQALALTYLGARYYDPTSARFLSADSAVRDAYAPGAHDRYAYVEGDPVNGWDPSGHMRRDIELMKERKQLWRSLMVQWEAAMDFCGSAPEFCQAGIDHATIRYDRAGNIVAVKLPGMDPAIAQWQWDRAVGAAKAEAASAGSGGGGGGSAGAPAPQPGAPGQDATTSGPGGGVLGAVMRTVFAMKPAPGPGDAEMSAPRDGSASQTFVIDEGPFKGVKVTVTVQTDADGKIVSATITPSAPTLGNNLVITDVKVQGDHVSGLLTRVDGTETASRKKTAEGGSKNVTEGRLAGDAKVEAGGTGESKANLADVVTEGATVNAKAAVGGSASYGSTSTSEGRTTNDDQYARQANLVTPLGLSIHVNVAPPPPSRSYIECVAGPCKGEIRRIP